jgi:hypothetical protein
MCLIFGFALKDIIIVNIRFLGEQNTQIVIWKKDLHINYLDF